MRINNNIVALNTTNNLSFVNRAVSKNMEKLSSGKKINSVADDSAGLAIANKLEIQSNGFKAANQNALDGISMIQTAEGAIDEINDMLVRMRELSIQSANGTNADDDRLKMQEEVSELVKEIDSIVSRTEFNNIPLINGQLNNYTMSLNGTVAATNIANVLFVSDKIEAGNLDYTLDKIGTPAKVTGNIGDTTTFPNDFFTLNGIMVTSTDTDTVDDVMAKIKQAAEIANIKVSAPSYPASGPLVFTNKNAGKDEKIVLGNNSSLLLDALFLTAGETKGFDPQISNLSFTNSYGVTDTNLTTSNSGNRIFITNADNEKIEVELLIATRNDGSFVLKNGTPVFDDGTISTGSITGMNVLVEDFGQFVLQVGPNKNMEFQISIPDVSSMSLGISNLTISNMEDANNAIIELDKAITDLNRIRSKLGAYTNRLEHTTNSLIEAETNTEMARSRILDADMAKEMTELTKNNVINQAGMAILAQANQRPQEILQLLK